MKNPLTLRSWSPYVVGAGIGVLCWFAFWSADNPIGVSTAFETSMAMAERAVVPRVANGSSYFDGLGKLPMIDWECAVVAGVFLGALLSVRLSGKVTRSSVPGSWAARFGPSAARRFLGAFVGGAVMIFGARLAGGCTSGHGISGTLQLALSSWLFLSVFFPVGVATAFLLYGKRRSDHV
jgi:uncharacterized protein